MTSVQKRQPIPSSMTTLHDSLALSCSVENARGARSCNLFRTRGPAGRDAISDLRAEIAPISDLLALNAYLPTMAWVF